MLNLIRSATKFRSLLIPCIIGLMLLTATSLASAGLIVSVNSVNATPTSTGNAFDVVLTNTSSTSTTIGGFSIGLTTLNPNITFTSVTIDTALPYIFAGHSGVINLLMLSSIDTTVGTSVQASDFYDIGLSGATIGAGQSVGLGHVIFDVGTITPIPTVITATLDTNQTTLSDADGNPVTVNSFVDGAISIPEPSAMALAILGLVSILASQNGPMRRLIAVVSRHGE